MAGTQQAWAVDVTTPLNASTLNTLAVAGSWLKSPATLTSGNVTISGASLVVGMPALVLAVNPGTTGGGGPPAYLSVSAGNVTLVSPAGNTTYYLYLSASGSYTYGTATTSTGLATILSVVTNSGGTGIASVAQVITPYALLASDVGAAPGVSISGFTYTALKTLADQIAAMVSAFGGLVDSAARTAINTLTGTSFGTNTKAAILSDGTNAGAAVNLPNTLRINGKLYDSNQSSLTAPGVVLNDTTNFSSATIQGTDACGVVSVTTRGALSSGAYQVTCTVTYGAAYSDTYSTSNQNPKPNPIALLTAQNSSIVFAAAESSNPLTGFTISLYLDSTVGAGGIIQIGYLVIG